MEGTEKMEEETLTDSLVCFWTECVWAVASQQQQSGAAASGPRSQLGFDKSSMGGNKENLGTVGRGVNRVSLQPIKKQKTDK